MTSQEWGNRVLSQRAGFTREGLTVPMGKRAPNGDIWTETGKVGEYRGETTYHLRNVETTEVREFPASELSRMQDVPLSHKDSVKLALSEGKPVPAEVLKDYPDLAATVTGKGASEWTPESVRRILAIPQRTAPAEYVPGAKAGAYNQHTTTQRLMRYGLTPEEYEKAVELDRQYSQEELVQMCRTLGLPTGGEKKALCARLLIRNRGR